MRKLGTPPLPEHLYIYIYIYDIIIIIDVCCLLFVVELSFSLNTIQQDILV
jgi:hypothetical protein